MQKKHKTGFGQKHNAAISNFETFIEKETRGNGIICCMRIMVPIRSSEYGPLDRSVQFLSSPDSDQQQLQVQQLHTAGPDWRKSVSAMHSSLLFSLSQQWHFIFHSTFTVMIFNF